MLLGAALLRIRLAERSHPRPGLEVLFAPHSGPLLKPTERVTRSKGLREPYEAGVRPSVAASATPTTTPCARVPSRRAAPSLPLPHAGRRAPGDLRLHRGLVQRRRHSGLDYLSLIGQETQVPSLLLPCARGAKPVVTLLSAR